jgi:hypothetical protein
LYALLKLGHDGIGHGGYKIPTRWVLPALFCAGVMIGSFVLTLWVINPVPKSSGREDLRSVSERLATFDVSGRTQLVEAALSLGLHTSRQMSANIDGISRINDREVVVRGWLADPGGDATPLKLLVFVAGKLAAATDTQGERPDVANALALILGAEKNVAFQASFGCSPGQQPIIVGLGTEKQYLRIKSPPCP